MLRWLDVTGLAENTVVIYSSDQGFYLGEHGWPDKRRCSEKKRCARRCWRAGPA
ncbi:MAG: hypothetical protein R2748_19715 [Bryobacterales bacterium]